MKGYTDIILSVLPVLSLFVFGYILQRIHFFKQGSIQDIKKLVVSIALPCLLFIAFSQLELQYSLLAIVVIVFMLCIVMVCIGKIVARILNISSPYFPLMLGGFETGMLGYAIFISVYGIQDIDKLAIIDLGQVLFVFFVLMALLIQLRDGTQNAGQLLKTFISSPVIIAIFAGIVVSLIKHQVDFVDTRSYQYVHQLVSMLGNLTVPLICLVIGYELKVDFGTLRLSAQTIVIRKILLLSFAILINKVVFIRILHLDPLYEYALLTMFILPPPFVISLFLKNNDVDNQQYVVNTLSLSTVVSIVLFIIVVMMYR
jgi:predicted permease